LVVYLFSAATPIAEILSLSLHDALPISTRETEESGRTLSCVVVRIAAVRCWSNRPGRERRPEPSNGESHQSGADKFCYRFHLSFPFIIFLQAFSLVIGLVIVPSL